MVLLFQEISTCPSADSYACDEVALRHKITFYSLFGEKVDIVTKVFSFVTSLSCFETQLLISDFMTDVSFKHNLLRKIWRLHKISYWLPGMKIYELRRRELYNLVIELWIEAWSDKWKNYYTYFRAFFLVNNLTLRVFMNYDQISFLDYTCFMQCKENFTICFTTPSNKLEEN